MNIQTELELLQTILDSQTPYPWDPSHADSEAVLSALEDDWDESGTEASIAAGWQTFSSQLNALWTKTPNTPVAAKVLATLQTALASRMPEALLQNIAQQAIALVQSGQPLMDQLVTCTQTVLSGWDSEDLTVLARPLAYSLRDGRGEIVQLQIQSVRQTDWAALSAIEKARLTLAATSIALKEAQSESE